MTSTEQQVLPPRRDLARAGRLGLIACALVALFMVFGSIVHLGLHRSDPTTRTRYHAIPVVMSQIYHGRPHDYTAYWSIAAMYQSNWSLPAVIDWTLQHKVPPNDRTYFWVADDRGYGE